MALLFMDDFDHYTTATLNEQYDAITTGSGLAISNSGRYGTYGLSMANFSNILKYITPSQTVIVGFAFKILSGSGGKVDIYLKNSGTNQTQFSLSGGFFNVQRGATLLGTSTIPIAENVWYFLEFKVYYDGAAGTIDIRVNGESAFTFTGDTTNTANSSANTVFFAGYTNIYLDDLYICNGLSAVNNDFLGDHRIENILPSGTGYITQWTPSAGTNYQNVDDPQSSAPCPDGDTTYNFTHDATNKDSFVFGNLVSTIGTVSGVQISCNARKDDAGNRSIRFFARIGGVNYYSSNYTLLDIYKYYVYVWNVSPATSVPWTISEVNGAEFGYELVS